VRVARAEIVVAPAMRRAFAAVAEGAVDFPYGADFPVRAIGRSVSTRRGAEPVVPPAFRADARPATTAPDPRAEPVEAPEPIAAPWSELRVAAMEFMGSGERPWTVEDLLVWSRTHLSKPGRMKGSNGDPPHFREPPVGIVYVPGAAVARKASSLPESDAGSVVEAARAKVASTLRGLLVWPSQDAFVHGALYGSRVERVADGGGSRWIVRVTPDTPVSDQVLALFAADLLEHRADYEGTLNVCDKCCSVGFDAPKVARFGCREHPRG
jgi:hypothetical protein